MQFKVKWDKAGGEKLADFKKKYEAFKNHIINMQLKGHIPDAEIYWVIERVAPVEPSAQLLLPAAIDPPITFADEIEGPTILVRQ